MKISILGAGNVGGSLGRAWARKGHDVYFGVPNPRDAKTQEVLTTMGAKAGAGTVAEAAAAGEVIVLATPWPATKAAIQAAGNLAGKVVVDCTNFRAARGKEFARRARHRLRGLLDEGAFADPRIGPAQREAALLGAPHRPFAGPAHRLGIGGKSRRLRLQAAFRDGLGGAGGLCRPAARPQGSLASRLRVLLRPSAGAGGSSRSGRTAIVPKELFAADKLIVGVLDPALAQQNPVGEMGMWLRIESPAMSLGGGGGGPGPSL